MQLTPKIIQLTASKAHFTGFTGKRLSRTGVYTLQKSYSEAVCMKPEIRKTATGSALFFGVLAVSAAGMQLANLRQPVLHSDPPTIQQRYDLPHR